MKNIGLAILAVCLGTLGSLPAQAQYDNTAYGDGALASDTSGSYNAAFGFDSLYFNNSGVSNTASGYYSLLENTGGSANTASGFYSLLYNQTGSSNTASGANSLENNTTGSYNSAFGATALMSNSTGNENVAIGIDALYLNSTGSNNIGIGYLSGYNNPVGASNNIDIGNQGSGSDNNPTIRIGTPGTQKAFFAAGIRGTKTGAKNAVEVMIDSNGQLGTVNSSIRFKEDVHDMAAASSGLFRLRPVTYRYKEAYADGSKPVDYGLIAEEVAEVYPDLVARDADGQIQTVQYQKLTPMLLNELQKEHKLLEQQAEIIQQLQKQLAALPLLAKRLTALEAVQPSSTMLETRLVTK